MQEPRSEEEDSVPLRLGCKPRFPSLVGSPFAEAWASCGQASVSPEGVEIDLLMDDLALDGVSVRRFPFSQTSLSASSSLAAGAGVLPWIFFSS